MAYPAPKRTILLGNDVRAPKSKQFARLRFMTKSHQAEIPIRILMLLENSNYDSDSRVVMEAETLASAGYSVTVICPRQKSRSSREVIRGVQVYRYPSPPELSGSLGYIVEYAYSLVMQFMLSVYVLTRHGFDAVHVHTPPDLTGIIGICYRLLGKKFVFDHHDLSPELYNAQKGGHGNKILHNALLFFERVSCRWANRLIATNQTQQQIQMDRCGATPEHCYIVRNGPNEHFLAHVRPTRLPHPASDKSVIGYVGEIGIQDGLEHLILALSELRSRGRHDFHAVIVGEGSDVKRIQAMTRECKLQDSVTFTGLVPFAEVPGYLASFDICTTPDPSNPYNDSCTTIKTMEYMALRKPTVCYETPENRNSAGASALYAADNDPKNFADALESLMDDAERRAAMGKIGRQRIDQKLAWKFQSENLLQLYEDLFGLVRTPDPSIPLVEAHSMAKPV